MTNSGVAQVAASPRPGRHSPTPYGLQPAGQRPQHSAASYPEPLQSLIEIGVLDRLAARTARVEDLSRAHPVWRVQRADGRRLVAKAGLGHGGPDLAIECLVYRMTNWCQPLAAVLPQALAIDEDRQLLVLTDVGGAGAGSLAQQQPAWLLLGEVPANLAGNSIAGPTCAAIGAAIGRIHRATAGFPLPPARPPLVLSLVAGTGGPQSSAAAAHQADEHQADAAVADQFAGLPALVQTTAAQLRSQSQIVAAANELSRPVAGCLVNHDLKWDNIVLTDPGTPVILDWELAGLGDPAWDLGCLLSEQLIRRNLPESGRQGSAQPTINGVAALDSGAGQLLRGYLEGARPRPEIVPILARRISLAAGLRVAQLALEVAYTPSGMDATTVTSRLITRASEILSDPRLIDEVQACLSSR